ncbi:MAG: hypothetical protein ACLTZT_13340 [Butyricimonas faecalis]
MISWHSWTSAGKSIFAIRVNAIVPCLKTPFHAVVQGKHPYSYLSLKANGKEVVLDLEINEDQRIILISGLQRGGKSVCLQTAGFITIHVPMRRAVPVEESSKFGYSTKYSSTWVTNNHLKMT